MTETTIVKVKTERPDEAEIRELAAKMVEANKAKALAAASAAVGRPPNGGVMGPTQAGSGGQLGIINFLNRKPGVQNEIQRPATDEKKTPAPDEASWKGHFGWDMLGKCHIPYIYRSAEKYVAVRMVEIKLLNKYLNYLHADIYSCTCIRSYYITEAEARLLNEINNRHCDGQFGRDPFTQKDLVVRLSDAYEFYNFLDVCYNKLLRGTTNNKDKCGFIRINKESVVPYTVRDTQKFVPLFYFEGETDNLKLKADQLKGWDLSYLKFCCKVQGIRNELFASETCSVISLTDIKSYFPPGTEFEEYWPNKVVESQLLISAKGSVSGGGQWTRAPPVPPPAVSASAHAAAVGAGGNARGRRPANARHSPAANALQLPHAGLSAAAVQALASGWNLPATLTQAQTQQVLRLAQAQVAAQAQAAARYNIAAAAAVLPQHRSQHQRNVQFPNSSITMAMTQQPPPPLVRSTANTTTMNNTILNGPSTTKNNHSEYSKEYRHKSRLKKQSVESDALQSDEDEDLQSKKTKLVDAQNDDELIMTEDETSTDRIESSTQFVPPQVTGTMNGHSTSHSVDVRKRLTPIPDISITGSHTPYKVQKALVENTMVPCINAKPYQYTDLLMTLPDLASHFFPRVSLATCRAMLDALGLSLYRPNSTQLQVLRNSGKCKSAAAGENGMALVQIRDVMQHMPQFKYMLRSGLTGEEHAQQQQSPRPAHAHPPHAKRTRAN